jgi:CheY-like chemotaxis protein
MAKMSRTILIVEDEPDIANYLAAVLRVGGFSPVVARDAETAFRVASETRPDLISLDIMMPKESGFALYQRLKSQPETDTIPVVIVSGVGQQGGIDFRSYIPDESIPEPDRYFEKPIDVEEYTRVVGELISSGSTLKKQGKR